MSSAERDNPLRRLLSYLLLLLCSIPILRAGPWHLLSWFNHQYSKRVYNCLNKITPQDEQDIQNSKAPVSQSDLPSDQQAPQSSQPESSPNPSGSANPTEQSPPSENSLRLNPSGSGGWWKSGQSGGGGRWWWRRTLWSGGSSGGGGDAVVVAVEKEDKVAQTASENRGKFEWCICFEQFLFETAMPEAPSP